MSHFAISSTDNYLDCLSSGNPATPRNPCNDVPALWFVQVQPRTITRLRVIFWRGQFDFHGTLSSTDEDGYTRFGTSIQITSKGVNAMANVWKVEELARSGHDINNLTRKSRVVTPQNRVDKAMLWYGYWNMASKPPTPLLICIHLTQEKKTPSDARNDHRENVYTHLLTRQQIVCIIQQHPLHSVDCATHEDSVTMSTSCFVPFGKMRVLMTMAKTKQALRKPTGTVDDRAMSPIRGPSATMQPRRAGVSDSEPKIEQPLATRALGSKRPDLYTEMTKAKVTLHKTYNSIKCISVNCKHCNDFYEHIDAKRLKRRLEPASDHEVEAATAPLPALDIGKSAVDVAFTLQKIRGYLDTTEIMEELVGVAAATELATYKRKLVEMETAKKQAEGQLKALRRQTSSQTSMAQKRPAEEDIDPRSSKLPSTEGAATARLPISAADLTDPGSVWNRLHNMTRPQPQDNYMLLAQWLQHREIEDFKGIPLRPPHFAVDLRDARGYQQVFTRIPGQTHGSDSGPKLRRRRCIIALMRILTVPGLYEAIIHDHNIPIDPLPQLTPCDFPESADDVDLLSDHDIAVLLAKRGLAVAHADDVWQFCHRYIRAEFGAGKSEFQSTDLIEILASEEKALKLRGIPLGLNSQDEDIYPRTVPSHRRPQANERATQKNSRRWVTRGKQR
ncbi:hypothetical protein C8F04DRAFT_1195969 [Mycena alexandri]|uniref:Uncharacterized protein n=1 Tax=Mycena alexandri TaxID=1745969 RepID=A0AAD6WNE7_9AGAR|nr:hypothetical protein C8F04DRAFT_1195969 [Mycena alexandri]